LNRARGGLFPHLRPLGRYLNRYRRDVAFGYLMMLGKSAGILTIPWLVRTGIDRVGEGAPSRELLTLSLWMLAASVAAGVFMYGMRWTLIGMSRRIEYDLRNDFFAQLISLSPSFFHRHRTGDLMARATNDLNAVRDVVGPGLMYALNTFTLVVASVVLMLQIDPILTLAVLAPFPVMATLVAYFSGEVHRRSLAVQDEYGRLQNAAQENLAGIRVVQANVQEAAETIHFTERSRLYRESNVALIRYRALFYATVAAVVGVDSLVLLWVGGARVISGALTIGGLVAFMAYLSQLTWPFIATGWVVSLLQRGEAAMQRILEVFQARPEITDGETVLSREAVRGAIRWEDVSYRYADGPWVLRHVSFEIPAGATVAVVGRTAAGKSTLAQLLPRLVDPDEGRILLDGHDLRALRTADLRRAVTIVPQEGFLFSDTLAENIRFGRPDVSDADVEAAARLAGLWTDIDSFPHGLETRVGERGITVSGGQRQRTALARALLMDAPVLVLDDALASVDKETEARLWADLRRVRFGRTTLVITHRASTAREADQIVVLEQGSILEHGSPDELLALGGAFADMSRRQELTEQLEAVDVGD